MNIEYLFTILCGFIPGVIVGALIGIDAGVKAALREIKKRQRD